MDADLADLSPTTFNSPISGLAIALNMQSLDTPRRRLSLDTDTSSGTPMDTPNRITLVIEKATPNSRHLEPLIEDDSNSPIEIQGLRNIDGDTMVTSEPASGTVQMEQSCGRNSASQAPMAPLFVWPNLLRPSSGSSLDDARTPGVLVSPAPSPVFVLDDDSRDSGYGPEATQTAAFGRKKLSNTDNSRRFSKGTDKEDDGIFESMELDEVPDLTTVNSTDPIASLFRHQILYNGNKPASVSTTVTDNSDGTPLKRKRGGRLTRAVSAADWAASVEDTKNGENVDATDHVANQSSFKRHKSFADGQFTSLRVPMKALNRCHSEMDAFLALHKEDNCHLIGDHSMPHALPILDRPRVRDLKCITSETLRRLLNGEFSHDISRYTLVDCRYPYEYEGGHIKGAMNIYTPEQLISLVFNDSILDSGARNCCTSSKRQIYVFYCEFSQERGPKMTRFMRKRDRQLNEHQYPVLLYPEIYLLDGGYKNFYASCRDQCEPQSYRSMHDEKHISELRKFRSKSKSWCSGAGDATDIGAVSSRRPGLSRGLFGSSKGY